MRKLANLLFVLFLLFLNGGAHAQTRIPITLNQVIPPSPTAASLGIYGEVNVGYYTGLPDISIPLFEAVGRGIRLPISLRYNASGTRTTDNASWVGLGWSLAAGGVITRTIRGLDDFKDNGGVAVGYYNAPSIPFLPNRFQYNTADWKLSKNYFDTVVKGEYDTEADLYNYNFGNFSGKFVLGKRADGGKVFVDEQNNLQIIYSAGVWQVIDAQGYKYAFNKAEQTTIYSYASNSQEAPSDISLSDMSIDPSNASVTTAWYISSITSPSGEKFVFEYSVGESLSLLNRTEAEYNAVGQYSANCRQNYGAGDQLPSLQAVYKNHTASKQVIQEVYLDKITYTGGVIEFIRTEREDIEYKNVEKKPSKLTQVTIKDYNGKIIKYYKLGYSYFGAPSDGLQRRLKLDAVTEYGQNNTAKPNYKLTYNDISFSLDKYTKSIDYWGYYNGKSNSKLIPPIESFPGADRSPDLTNVYPKQGVLTAITYPTGGRTEFDYELHEYGNIPIDDQYKDVQSGVTAGVSQSNPLKQVEEFDLTKPTQVSLFSSYNEANCASDGCQLRSTYTSLFMLDMQNQSGSWTNQYSKSNSRPDPGSDQQYYTQENFSDYIYLGPGHYRISVWKVPGYSIKINASWTDRVKIIGSDIKKKGAGIRIKTISSYDGTSLLKKRSFFYTQDGTITGRSSGVLFNQPQLSFFCGVSGSYYYTGNVTSGCFYNEATYLGRMSSSINSPGLISKGLVGYSKVTEIISSAAENGRTEYTYYNNADGFSTIPTMPVSGNPLNGKAISIVQYNSIGNILKKIEYSYKEKLSEELLNAKVFPAPASNGAAPPGTSGYELQTYKNLSSWYVLSSQKETFYKDNQSYISTKSFTYDNPIHKEVSTETVDKSNDESITTYNYYGSDYISNNTGFIADMRAAHILSAPVEQVVILADKDGLTRRVISSKLTSYHTGLKAGLPASVWKSKLVVPIELGNFKLTVQAGNVSLLDPSTRDSRYPADPDVQFTYTDQNQLQQQKLAFDGSISYLWGYNSLFPIAEVKNAIPSEVLHENFEEQLNWDTSLIYDTNLRHTGLSAAVLSPYSGQQLHSFAKTGLTLALTRSKKFILSGWVYSTGPQAQLWLFKNRPTDIDGTTVNYYADSSPAYISTDQTSQWVYLHQIVEVPADITRLTIRLTGWSRINNGQVWFDDIRLYPVDAQMTTYTHQPLVGTTSVSNVVSLPIYYEYDELNRLKLTRDHMDNIRQYQQYYYRP